MRNMQELLECVREFTREIGLSGSASMTDLEDYFRAMTNNRAFGIRGTTPGNGTIWLFLLARMLNPKVIVESGVHGSSLFTLREPFRMRKYSPSMSTSAHCCHGWMAWIIAEHWGTDDVRAQGPSDLCFFDDHINNSMGSGKATTEASAMSSLTIFQTLAKSINSAIPRFPPCP